MSKRRAKNGIKAEIGIGVAKWVYGFSGTANVIALADAVCNVRDAAKMDIVAVGELTAI